MNTLSGAGVLAEDKLFATLDPVVRKTELPAGTEIILSDTVGFINKLPHELVKAFRSTLEEVSRADLILHVIDVSSPHHDKQMQVVEDVLADLGAGDKPRIDVFNKTDKLEQTPDQPSGSDGRRRVFISAKEGFGIGELLKAVETMLNSSRHLIDTVIPYSRYEAVSFIYKAGSVIEEEHTGEGTHIRAYLDEADYGQLKKLL